MIRSWRERWHEASLGTTAADMPFGLVQLSASEDKANTTCGGTWPPSDTKACSWATVRSGQTADVGYVPVNP